MNREKLAGLLMPGFEGTEIPDWVQRYLQKGLKSLAIYGSNIENPKQLRNLVSELRSLSSEKLLVATDEEGGDVTRVEYKTGSSFSGNRRLGKVDDLQQTSTEAKQIARICSYAGININLAPVVDVNSNPENPVIGNRSFGDNQDIVSKHLVSWIQAHQAQGVACTAKHFPGHGDTSTDSHHGASVVSGGWKKIRAEHLTPFIEAIQAEVGLIMTGHLLVDSDTPVSQSSEAHQLLRDLGFEGVIVTDALDMKAATQDGDLASAAIASLRAGADLLCLGPNTTEQQLERILDEIQKAIDRGKLSSQRLERSIERVETLANIFPVAENPDWPELENNPLDLGIEVLPPISIYRLNSFSNPAVGEVPWLPIEDQLEVIGLDFEMLSNLVLEDGSAILVRDQKALQELAHFWPNAKTKKDLVIFSPGPINDWCGFSGVDLFGSSVPHARALVKYLKG